MPPRKTSTKAVESNGTKSSAYDLTNTVLDTTVPEVSYVEPFPPLVVESEEMPTRRPMIYQALANCIKDIGTVGVEKGEVNTFQKFNYRSIDGALAAFNKVFAKNQICLQVKTLNTVFENLGSDQYGKTIWGVTFDLEVIFFAIDGSHITSFHSIANDGKDLSKLMGQATSYALKELLFKQFVTPIEGGDDIDARDENERPKVHPSNVNSQHSDSNNRVSRKNPSSTTVSVKTDDISRSSADGRKNDSSGANAGETQEAVPQDESRVQETEVLHPSLSTWVNPDLKLGADYIVKWASEQLEITKEAASQLLADTPANEQGKKGTNFVVAVKAKWDEHQNSV